MHDLASSLSQIRNAWLAGRSALDLAPPQWRDVVGEDELVLIALAGHATDVLTRRAPAAALAERPLLPALAAPLLPDALRSRFRRLLATPKNAPSLEKPLLAFTAARGFAAHPADWMPDAKDDWAPELYAPWLHWVRAEAVGVPADETIGVENYEQWPWGERRKALETLRARDPMAALAIVAAKAAAEPAERRLRLIETLQVGLSESDTDYLESLAKDRSDRVQAFARGLLARLGRGVDASDLAAELAAMLELKSVGLIKRHKQLSITPLKTGAQTQRRRELFGLVPLASLAAALGANERELTEHAPDGHVRDMFDFAACVALTGSDGAVRALVASMLASEHTPAALIRPLLERLSPSERRPLLARVIARDTDLFETTLAIAGEFLGGEPLAIVEASPHFGAVQSNINIFLYGDDAGRPAATRALDIMLPRIGLLLDARGARTLLDQAVAWGLSPAEPRLDMLHFNIALAPETPP